MVRQDLNKNNDKVKAVNHATIYRAIIEQQSISRIQLAELCQLAPASVTKITRQLLSAGLINEVERQDSTGGRPPISLVAKTAHLQTIAIHLSRTHITLELYNLACHSICHQHANLQADSQQLLELAIISTIEKFKQSYKHKIKQIIAISIVMPGLIDAQTSTVKYIPHLSITEWPLKQILQNHFKLPCYIGHNIRALALAEHYFGTTQKCDNSILIRVHRGVGAGIMINGQLFLGKNSYVGEIGHIQIDPLGKRCHCGNFGCLESIVSNDALQQQAIEQLKQGRKSLLTIEHCDITAICNAANLKDKLAIELIELAGQKLGEIIAIMLNILNPQKIVIAGDITLSNHLLSIIDNSIAQHTLTFIHKNVSLGVSLLDHRSTIGAFALIRQALFQEDLLNYLLKKST